MEMTKKEAQDIAQLALDIGGLQLSYSAEIWRVEETVDRICRHFGLEDVDAFIISNGLLITAKYGGDVIFTQMKHIPIKGVHLGLVGDLNDLSRAIERGEYTVEEAEEEFQKIRDHKSRPMWMQCLGAAVGTGCFCMILGGNAWECFGSFLSGLVLQLVVIIMGHYQLPKMVNNVIGGFVIAVCASLFVRISGPMNANVDAVVVGTVLALIPGCAFINSLREIADSDFIAGAIRMIDTLMLFVYIAIGTSFGLLLFH